MTTLMDAFATNERINQFLLENLDAAAWRAEPPGGKGRTIAAIAAHIHNVRHMWLAVSAKGTKFPDKVHRDKVTIPQARRALAASADAVIRLLESSLTSGRVKNAGMDPVAFFAYALSHEAHHRGQICLLARQVGHPLSKEATFAMWDWKKMALSS
ncbi:MAG TPA: DinB family protein [Thermoanaerobaculia bacterium]|nr:DinB family protein [Thermoanaerobaculia bacterium]